MTVKELKSKLNNCPENAIVCVSSSHGDEISESRCFTDGGVILCYLGDDLEDRTDYLYEQGFHEI